MNTFRKPILIFFILPLIFLSGCFNEKKEETFKTVEYYIKNKEAREARKKECLAMTDTTETVSKDCANVNSAINKTMEYGGSPDTTGIFK